MSRVAEPAWDLEIELIQQHASHMATAHKETALIGVAVDDEAKRDYFIPRLQAILDGNTWAQHLTFRIVPVLDGEPIDLRAALAEPRE